MYPSVHVADMYALVQEHCPGAELFLELRAGWVTVRIRRRYWSISKEVPVEPGVRLTLAPTIENAAKELHTVVR